MDDLQRVAAAEAEKHSAASWDAVEADCIQSAIEFLADNYLHHPEDPAKTVFQAEADYVAPEALAVMGPPSDLCGTEIGQQIEERLGPEWMLAVTAHLLSVPGTGSLLAWAEQERHRLHLDSLATAVLWDHSSTLGLSDSWSEKVLHIISNLGEMTVAQVLAADNGAAFLRANAERMKQSQLDKARNEQAVQARQFYNEIKARFLLAGGLDDRTLQMGDLDAVSQAVTTLGWTRRQQAMFADGAPRKSMSNNLRGLMRQKFLGSATRTSAPAAP